MSSASIVLVLFLIWLAGAVGFFVGVWSTQAKYQDALDRLRRERRIP